MNSIDNAYFVQNNLQKIIEQNEGYCLITETMQLEIDRGKVYVTELGASKLGYYQSKIGRLETKIINLENENRVLTHKLNKYETTDYMLENKKLQVKVAKLAKALEWINATIKEELK